MSTLLIEDFTDEEVESIEYRLSLVEQDIAQLEAEIAASGTDYDNVVAFDAANQKVQTAAIEELITALYAVVQQRDVDAPSHAPHFVLFNTPDEEVAPSWPILVPGASTLLGSDDLETWLAALPAYSVPFETAALVQGPWVLRRQQDPGPGQEDDPSQPTVDEPLPGYAVLEPQFMTEFSERNAERLHSYIGSYLLAQSVLSKSASNTEVLALLEQRRDFWKNMGFGGE